MILLTAIILVAIVVIYYSTAKVILYTEPNYGGIPVPLFTRMTVASGTPRTFHYKSFINSGYVVFSDGSASTALTPMNCADLASIGMHLPQVVEQTPWATDAGVWTMECVDAVTFATLAKSNMNACLDRVTGRIVNGEKMRPECKDFTTVVDESGAPIFVVSAYASDQPLSCEFSKGHCGKYDSLSRIAETVKEPFLEAEPDRMGMANTLGNRRTLNFSSEI